MSGYFPKDFLAQVRGASDIVEIISSYVKLRHQGKNEVGLCPFHSEKTPSFTVSREKQLFHCFGCGAGGDIVKFVMLIENLSFYEAVKFLAERCGLRLPATRKSTDQRDRRKEQLLKVNELALHHFVRNLNQENEGRKGLSYLRERGLNRETAESFQLGYARSQWDDLYRFLLQQGFKEPTLVDSGLVAKSSQGEGYYDFFRGRLIFPICNSAGRVIGFGGRTIGEEEPKYLNSPETMLFNKSWSLFGINLSHQEIRKKNRALLVEGYFDLMTLYQAGFANAVAPLGTSFTEGQAKMLSRYTKNVVISFDPDEGGRRATHRAITTLLGQGFTVEVKRLPEGLDPDAFVQKHGPQGFKEELDKALPAIDYLMEETKEMLDLSHPQGKVAALNFVIPFLACIGNQMERVSYVGYLAERFQVEDRAILAELRRAVRGRKSSLGEELTSMKASLKEAEARLLQILICQPEVREELLPLIDPHCFSQPIGERLLAIIRELHQEGKGVTFDQIFDRLEEGDKSRFTQIALGDNFSWTKGFALECLNTMKRDYLDKEIRKVQQEIEHTETDKAPELDKLLRAKLRLLQQRDAL